jgi:hypothetical protein
VAGFSNYLHPHFRPILLILAIASFAAACGNPENTPASNAGAQQQEDTLLDYFVDLAPRDTLVMNEGFFNSLLREPLSSLPASFIEKNRQRLEGAYKTIPALAAYPFNRHYGYFSFPLKADRQGLVVLSGLEPATDGPVSAVTLLIYDVGKQEVLESRLVGFWYGSSVDYSVRESWITQIGDRLSVGYREKHWEIDLENRGKVSLAVVDSGTVSID